MRQPIELDPATIYPAAPGSRPRIGLLGGIGPVSTRLYYERLMAEGRERLGAYPDLVVHSLDFDRFTWLEDHDRAGYVRLIRSSLELLVSAGADVVAMAANSPHAVWDEVTAEIRVDTASIVESVVAGARDRGLGSVLLLGIPATMRADFYPRAFAAAGISVVVPERRHDGRIRRIIFDELTGGVRSAASRRWLLGLLDSHPADGLVLGCTELPELIRPEDAPVPVLDSAGLHVSDILGVVEDQLRASRSVASPPRQ